jgi:diadenosine tetraphosphate (Ap4A) HIT family hydrolase
MQDNCVFCRELGGSRNTNFARLYPELASRILFETDSLVAFPCIGQLVEGHFLIVSKEHRSTLAEVACHNDTFVYELQTLIEVVHSRMGMPSVDSLLFEHGAIGSEDGGCGIYHAHLHVVPRAGHLQPSKIFDFKSDAASTSIESIFEQIPARTPYVLVGNMVRGMYAQSLVKPLASQTLRRNVAQALGVGAWDWRSAEREPLMLKLLSEVSV